MSRLNELIAGLCPDGVEFFELGKVTEYSRERIDASKVNATNYVGVDNLLPDKGGKTFSNYVPTEGRLIYFSAGDILIGNIRPYLKKIWLATHDGGTNGDVLVIKINDRSKLMPEFLYFLLSSDGFFIYAMQHAKGAKMPRGDKSAVMKYAIPAPPLPVQQEIVRILDKFTALEAELEAELEARKKQYEYYLDQILSYEGRDDVRWMMLGEVCTVTDNINWRESQEKYKYIDLTSVSRDTHKITETIMIDKSTAPSRAQKLLKKDDIIFATTRPTLRRFAIITDEYDGQVCSTGFCVLRANQKDVLPKWIYYNIAKTDFYIYMESVQKGSAYPAVSDSDVKKYKIPIPPLVEQERIVAILDRFDALVNDITQGLPAEIAARRKQYEYYRDKLLTFKEKVS